MRHSPCLDHCLALSLAILLGLLCLGTTSLAEDWPQWRGPNRDGISTETGLLKEWPDDGPKLLWKAEGLGAGYSGPSIVGNLLYTMGDIDGKECVMALDWKKGGKKVWTTPIGPVRHNGGGYAGPRCTPTYDAGKIYVMGINGDVACLDAKTGRGLWKRDMAKEFGADIPRWGYSESPLIDGNLVICAPGGSKGSVVALNKQTGKTVWATQSDDKANYSSLYPATVAGVKQYLGFLSEGVVGIDAKTGKRLWRYEAPAHHQWGGVNVATPVAMGDLICSAAGYGVGGGVAEIKRAGRNFNVDEKWFSKRIENHHGGLILKDGVLFSASNPGVLTAVDFKSGEVLWRDRKPGKGSLVIADGMLICRSEKGPVSLVEATPDEYRLKGHFKQPDRSDKPSWPHPVVANGLLFLRDQDVLLCYDLRAK